MLAWIAAARPPDRGLGGAPLRARLLPADPAASWIRVTQQLICSPCSMGCMVQTVNKVPGDTPAPPRGPHLRSPLQGGAVRRPLSFWPCCATPCAPRAAQPCLIQFTLAVLRV